MQPPLQIVREQPYLGRPRGVLDLHEQGSVLEANRPDMGSQGAADGLLPAAEDTTDLGPAGSSPQRLHDAIQRVADRDGVAVAHDTPASSDCSSSSTTAPAVIRNVRSGDAAAGTAPAVVMTTWPDGR